MTTSGQYLRKVQLLVSGSPQTPGGTGIAVPSSTATQGSTTQAASAPSGNAADTSNQSGQNGLVFQDQRIQFTVNAQDTDSPPTALIRIYNLAQNTANQIQKQFQNVSLQAGYETGNFGVIFQGTIIRIRKGRLSNIDSFVDIMASNLGALYQYAIVNRSLPAGATPKDQAQAVSQNVSSSQVAQGNAGALAQGLQLGNIPNSMGTGGTLPRGKVLFGLWSTKMNQVADSSGTVWSVGPDGKVNFHDLTGYLPGEAVVINAQTGMVGVPVATTQGIEVKCLLNPLIKPGCRIKLNNADITTTTNESNLGFPAYSDIESAFIANTSTDGTYVCIVVEHEGDSRDPGSSWLTSIIALAVDSSGNSGSGTVPAYG